MTVGLEPPRCLLCCLAVFCCPCLCYELFCLEPSFSKRPRPQPMSEQKEQKDEQYDATRLTSPLASIQLLRNPRPIPGKDNIVAASVQGYDVVVSKDFFKDETPACIFFEMDALLDPQNDAFKDLDSKKGRRVVSKNFSGGFVSQGFCAPLSVLTQYGLDPEKVRVGQDVTSALKVTKYLVPKEAFQYNKGAGFPAFPSDTVPKTDELNVQSANKKQNELAMSGPEMFAAVQNRRISITLKLDGSSMTVTSDGEICGRNYIWDREDKSNKDYFEVARKLKILEKIKGSGYHVQGELVGPKIQGNRLGLKEVDWFVFNIFSKGKYLPHSEVVKLCLEWGFSVVPSLDPELFDKKEQDMETRMKNWLQVVDKLTYPYPASDKPAEGIVVKTEDHGENLPRISFKMMSRNYKAAA
jgi:RNA ligase (TIGR02306 family)